MPSAARQRLPLELLNSPEPSSKTSVPLHHASDIQANPGYSELSHEKSGLRSCSPAVHKFNKRQYSSNNRKHKKSLPRRGSSADIFRDHAVSNLSDSQQAVSASACSDSECGISYNSSAEGSDFFAVDSVKAPPVDALPQPPPEWLTKLSKKVTIHPAVMHKVSLERLFGNVRSADPTV